MRCSQYVQGISIDSLKRRRLRRRYIARVKELGILMIYFNNKKSLMEMNHLPTRSIEQLIRELELLHNFHLDWLKKDAQKRTSQKEC